jgi:hypothetical protein
LPVAFSLQAARIIARGRRCMRASRGSVEQAAPPAFCFSLLPPSQLVDSDVPAACLPLRTSNREGRDVPRRQPSLRFSHIFPCLRPALCYHRHGRRCGLHRNEGIGDAAPPAFSTMPFAAFRIAQGASGSTDRNTMPVPTI